MSSVPTSALVAAGLVGGFASARYTHRRELGGALFAVAGAAAAREWLRAAGGGATAGLLGLYAAAMGGSHPLAKQIGAWPSVLAVTAVAAGAAHVVGDRRAH
ncbi:MAG: hypothetical protein ACTHMS_18095 [Jatrophihabitans sp.]|uniref:hypothetical protein n=1 Tax=Jatrophihabitans sp. TaxID=1932789 RepID=UPI003F7E6B16